MPSSRLDEFRAPIEYADIRTAFQLVRAAGALVLTTIAAIGMAWHASTSLLLLLPGTIALIHASYRLRRPGTSALTSLIIDSTLIASALIVIGEVPATEIAALAYVIIASLLLLHLIEAALVIAYSSLLAVVVINLAPASDFALTNRSDGVTVDRVLGVLFLVLIAAVVFAASKVVRLFRVRQSEALDIERRANVLKNEFVSMVSHELRTPLTSIAGFIETLQETWRQVSSEEVDEFLAIIRSEARHLSNLVEDLLVIPRLEAGNIRLKTQDFEMRSIAQQVLELVFPGAAKEAEVALPTGIIVRADTHRVVQVLRNLLENARKYGGDQILVEGMPQGPLYKVMVSDNGPGVPESDRTRIFEHFEQVSKGDDRTDTGIGLGLPIARKLVRAMGGELWYEDRFPTGASLCFTLPLRELSQAATDGEPPAPGNQDYSEGSSFSSPAETRQAPM